MAEYVNMSKGLQKRHLKTFVLRQRAQGAFNAQPKFRAAYNEMKMEQAAHSKAVIASIGFGVTRYNKNKHK